MKTRKERSDEKDCRAAAAATGSSAENSDKKACDARLSARLRTFDSACVRSLAGPLVCDMKSMSK